MSPVRRARRMTRCVVAGPSFGFGVRVGSVSLLEDDIERVEQSWDIEDDCQHDADHEFASHSLFESHGEGWEQDRDDDE